jgi:hypothetical protein
MKFFVPATDSNEQAERVYSAIAQFVAAPITEKRIQRLSWRHNDMAMSCEVGGPLPRYYQTGEEPVLAIFDCGTLYKICTPNRGGIRGEPVCAGKDSESRATYFD